MLEAFRKAFKIKDIRKKIGYTFLMLIVIRIGSQLPTPGVNGEYIKNFFAQNTGEAFNLFNAFTGGSFEQMSVFALSITPYITSSIIVQLLTIAIPQLEEMQRDGETGRKKIVPIHWQTERKFLNVRSGIILSFGADWQKRLRNMCIKETNFMWRVKYGPVRMMIRPVQNAM